MSLTTSYETATELETLSPSDHDAISDHYEQHGFVGVHGLLSAQQISDCCDAFVDLADQPDMVQLEDSEAEAPSFDLIRKFMNFGTADPRLHAAATAPAMIDIVDRLLATSGAHRFQDMALLKPPRIGREKPWHQDCAYFTSAPDVPVVGVWIALDAATVRNGCMRVVDGGHRLGYFGHVQDRDWQIPDEVSRDFATQHEIVAAPLQPGGALFFNGLVPHGTPTNTSDDRRRALQFHFRPADARLISDDERQAVWAATPGR